MRWWVIVASLWLLTAISLCEAQTGAQSQKQRHGGAPNRGKKRRSGQGRSKGDRAKQLKRRLVPGHSIPVNHGDYDGTTLFIESYKSLGEPHSSYNVLPGKQGQCVFQGIKMFDQSVWSPKPCVTCFCTGGQVVCDEITCPPVRCHFPYTSEGECCPICMEQVPDLSDLSGDSPVPNDPSSDPLTPDPETPPLTPEEIQRIIWREEEEHREEEEQLRRRDERRRRKKEEAERQRKLAAEEKMRRNEEERRRQEEEEEERRRKEEEGRRRQEEEDRRVKEAAERKVRERQKKLEKERRRQEEVLREKLRALEEEEEEEEVWLRGDVFSMSTNEPEEPDLLPAPIPKPPEEEEGEEDEEMEEVKPNRAGLPPGCDISDVIMTCENAKLTHFPPLAIPELISLSLEGNSISSIPEGAFNGIPNLEWMNLSKNKLTSVGIAPKIFKGLKHLNRLYLDNNLLEEIPSGLPSTLQELKINENQLRTVNENVLQGLSSLVILELEGNILSEGNMAPEAFSGLQQLSYLRLGQNYFRTIPQGLPSTLLELYLENNLIEEISDTVFNQTTNLNVISLRHNRLDESRITPLAWINHRNLESIDLSYNHLYLVPSYLPRSLVHLVLAGNQIERIPGYVFAHMDPGLEYLYLSYNKLDGDGIEPESFFGSFHSMVELCLDHNKLVSVPSGINEMTSLHFLRLNNNHIRDIPVDSICDPSNEDDSSLVALRLENNYIDPRKISPSAFSCVRSYSSVVFKPQNIK